MIDEVWTGPRRTLEGRIRYVCVCSCFSPSLFFTFNNSCCSDWLKPAFGTSFVSSRAVKKCHRQMWPHEKAKATRFRPNPHWQMRRKRKRIFCTRINYFSGFSPLKLFQAQRPRAFFSECEALIKASSSMSTRSGKRWRENGIEFLTDSGRKGKKKAC